LFVIAAVRITIHTTRFSANTLPVWSTKELSGLRLLFRSIIFVDNK